MSIFRKAPHRSRSLSLLAMATFLLRLREPLEWPGLSPLLLCLRFYSSLADPAAALWSTLLNC
jgi:hypothetical protein